MEEGAPGLDPIGEMGLVVAEVFEVGKGPVGFEDGPLRRVQCLEDPRFAPIVGGLGDDVERQVKHVIAFARPLPTAAIGKLVAQ